MRALMLRVSRYFPGAQRGCPAIRTRPLTGRRRPSASRGSGLTPLLLGPEAGRQESSPWNNTIKIIHIIAFYFEISNVYRIYPSLWLIIVSAFLFLVFLTTPSSILRLASGLGNPPAHAAPSNAVRVRTRPAKTPPGLISLKPPGMMPGLPEKSATSDRASAVAVPKPLAILSGRGGLGIGFFSA
jgi:hypothetical protein